MQCECAILPPVACPALQNVPPAPHISHKRNDFRTKDTEHKMCVLIFSTTLVWNISHSKKNSARYDQKCILVFMWSTGYSCQTVIKLEFSRAVFRKITEYEVPWKSVQWHRVVSCGRTGVTKLTITSRNFANAPQEQNTGQLKTTILHKADVLLPHLSMKQLAFTGVLCVLRIVILKKKTSHRDKDRISPISSHVVTNSSLHITPQVIYVTLTWQNV
jgi:hypothetical protein